LDFHTDNEQTGQKLFGSTITTQQTPIIQLARPQNGQNLYTSFDGNLAIWSALSAMRLGLANKAKWLVFVLFLVAPLIMLAIFLIALVSFSCVVGELGFGL